MGRSMTHDAFEVRLCEVRLFLQRSRRRCGLRLVRACRSWSASAGIDQLSQLLLPRIAMPPRLPVIVRPSELRYDHGEVLSTGAHFMRMDTLDGLRQHWTDVRSTCPFVACGTGASHPPMFLERHEWVFAPTEIALIKAVTRWEELKISPRWYDSISEEVEIHEALEASRVARRGRLIKKKRWTESDEIAYSLRTQRAIDLTFKGYWRLTNLPCGLSHYDWFSEHARLPVDPSREHQAVEIELQQLTYQDWKKYRPLDDVQLFEGQEVDEDIEYWQRERDEGREPYED